MSVREFDRLRPGGWISAREDTRQKMAVEALARSASVGAILVSQTGSQPVPFFDPADQLWIKITGGTNPYSYSEQQDDGDGTFSDLPEGRAGTYAGYLPAYEVMGVPTVPANAIRRAWVSADQQSVLFVDAVASVPPGDVSFTGDVTVGGNLTVVGLTTVVDLTATGDVNFGGDLIVGGTTTLTVVVVTGSLTVPYLNLGVGYLTATTPYQYDDLDIVGYGILYVLCEEPTTITGFAGGTHGRELKVINIGPENLTLEHEHVDSAAANRILTSLDSPMTYGVNEGVSLNYETGESSRWRPADDTGAGGGAATYPLVTDEGTDVPDASLITFDPDSGFAVSADGAGQARVNLALQPPQLIAAGAGAYTLVATFNFGDLAGAANNDQVLAAYTLPASVAVLNWLVVTTIAGAGPGLMGLSLQLQAAGVAMGAGMTDGTTVGSIDDQRDSFDAGKKAIRSVTGTTAITLRFQNTGCLLSQLTAGRWKVYLCLAALVPPP